MFLLCKQESHDLSQSVQQPSACFGCSVQFLIQLHFQVSVGLHPLHVNTLDANSLLVGPGPSEFHHHLLKLGAVEVEVVGVALQNKIQFPFNCPPVQH